MMYLKIRFITKTISFFLILVLISCNSAEKEKHKSKLIAKSRVINLHFFTKLKSRNLNVSLAFIDSFGNRIQYDYDLTNGKKYDLKIDSEAPIFLKDLSFKQTSYLVYPGENLDVELDSAGYLLFKSLKKDKIRNNELNFFNAYDQIPSKSKKILSKSFERFPGITQILSSRKADAFLEFLLIENLDAQKGFEYGFQRYKDQMAYLEEYSKHYPISNSYKNHLSNFFTFEELKFRLSIINNKLSKGKDVNLSTQIPKIINKINCDSCLYVPGYKESIQQYVKHLYNFNKQMKRLNLYENLKESFNGATCDFALFTLIKQALAENNTEYKELLSQFENEKRNSIYVAYLKKISEARSIIPSENTILMGSDGKLTDLDKVLSMNVGKVILLDFWASWCLPCKAQMPFAEKLKEKYKNQEVAFIYLSLDEEKSSWETSSKQLKLLSSYLIMDNFRSNLSKKLSIKTIPRYVLIDKNGKISNKDAPRPSDKKLADEINALLLKK